MRSVLALVLVAACTPSAYAPPARLISLDSPSAPTGRRTDLAAEVGRVGSLFGPDVAAGNLRARHSLSDNIVVEGEAGMATVENEGTIVVNQPLARTSTGTVLTSPSTSRDAYTGRGGVILQGIDGGLRGALTAGIGGGYSATAGSWTAVDMGASFGGTGRWVRPWFGADVSVNRPVHATPFTVQYTDLDQTDTTTLELTANTTIRGTLGMEIGPAARTFMLGLSITSVSASASSEVGAQADGTTGGAFVALAAGFRALL